MTKSAIELPDFYQRYVDKVAFENLTQALIISGNETLDLIRSIPEKSGAYAYDKGKWTIKEVVAHIIDAERIFAYRALRFARNDSTQLAGYDENSYTPESNANNRTLYKLAEEVANVRASTSDLFNSFSEEMKQRKGYADSIEMSVEALGFVIVGHETHHREILLERYLSN